MKKTKEYKCPNSKCESLNIKDLGSRGPFRGTPKKGEFSNFKLKGLPAWKEDEVHMFRDDGIKMHHYVIRDIRALADKQGIDGVPPTTVTWGNVEKVCVKYEKLGKKQLEILNYFK